MKYYPNHNHRKDAKLVFCILSRRLPTNLYFELAVTILVSVKSASQRTHFPIRYFTAPVILSQQGIRHFTTDTSLDTHKRVMRVVANFLTHCQRLLYVSSLL